MWATLDPISPFPVMLFIFSISEINLQLRYRKNNKSDGSIQRHMPHRNGGYHALE